LYPCAFLFVLCFTSSDMVQAFIYFNILLLIPCKRPCISSPYFLLGGLLPFGSPVSSVVSSIIPSIFFVSFPLSPSLCVLSILPIVYCKVLNIKQRSHCVFVSSSWVLGLQTHDVAYIMYVGRGRKVSDLVRQTHTDSKILSFCFCDTGIPTIQVGMQHPGGPI